MVSPHGGCSEGVGRAVRRRAAHVAEQGRRGVAVLELAILLPLLVGLALGTVDYGRFTKASVCVNHAASVGVYYATSSASASSDQAGIRSAVLQDLQGLDGINPADVTVSATSSTDPDGYPSVVVVVSVPFRTLFQFPVDVVTISQSCPMRVRPV
ncbi:MAG: hypothetical protein NVSMB9_12440 [Isosphaeraceae bacterium]